MHIRTYKFITAVYIVENKDFCKLLNLCLFTVYPISCASMTVGVLSLCVLWLKELDQIHCTDSAHGIAMANGRVMHQREITCSRFNHRYSDVTRAFFRRHCIRHGKI